MALETLTSVPTTETRRRPRSRLAIGLFGSSLALTANVLAACGNDKKVDTAASATPSTVAAPKPGPAVLLKGSDHPEIQQFGASTFTDYTRAYGVGPYLQKGTKVDVDCLATGPTEAAPTAKGKWYHIEGPSPYTGYYAAANTFENGDTSGPLNTQPATDPNVPACPK